MNVLSTCPNNIKLFFGVYFTLAIMITWFSNDILYFTVYSIVGFGGLALLVHRPYLSRWARFLVGFVSVIYGTLGLLSGNQLFKSLQTMAQVMPWSEIETSKLVNAASSIELASLVLQFVFAAVGAGLITNAIIIEKPLSPPSLTHHSSGTPNDAP